MLRSLKLRDSEGIDPVVLGMRPDEFHKCDPPAEIESDYHPKITSGDFEPRTFPVQNLCVRSGGKHLVHRTPFGVLDQRPPAMERHLRLRMPFGVRRQHAPSDNSHADQYVPKTGTLQ
jgi:hypothetical protein